MQTLMNALRAHADSSRQQAAPASVPTETVHGDTLLKILYREDRKPEEGRFGSTLIHASSFVHMPACARMLFLGQYMKAQGVTYSNPVFGSMKLVWAYGRAAEKHVRDTLLSDPDMRRAAWGRWRCPCRHTETRGHLHASPERCPRCRQRANIYAEGTSVDRAHGIAGNPDFVYLLRNRYKVVEIKSIKEGSTTAHGGFNELESPQPMHVEQGVHYVRLLENEGLPVHPEPDVLYVNKGYSTKTWYKQFTPSDAMMERAREDVDNARRVSRQYTEALASGQCPPMLARCAADNTSLQKDCQVWAECIGRSRREP